MRNPFPAGILMSSALLVAHHCSIDIPVVNMGTEDVWLPPHTQLVEQYVVDPSQLGSSVVLEETDDQHTVTVVQKVVAEPVPPLDFSSLSWPNLSSDQV